MAFAVCCSFRNRFYDATVNVYQAAVCPGLEPRRACSALTPP